VRNVLPSHAQSIYRNAFNSAVSQGRNEVTARKIAWGAVKKQYKKNAQGKWVRKEEYEVEYDVVRAVDGTLTILEEDEDGGGGGALRFEGTAMIDNVVSSHRRFYPPTANNTIMELSNERARQPNKVMTIFSRHGKASGSFFSPPMGIPIGSIEGDLFRSGDRIRYNGRILPTTEGKDMQVLVREGVMRATSIRMRDFKARVRKLDGKEVEEVLSAVIIGIDFAEDAGIAGAGVDRILEEAPQWDEPTEEGEMEWKEVTLEQLQEERKDLLDAYTVNLVAALNARITELEGKAAEQEGSVTKEQHQTAIDEKDTTIAQLTLELGIEKAAQIGVGEVIAAKLREKGVKSAGEIEQVLPAIRSEALAKFLKDVSGEQPTSQRGEVRTDEDDDKEKGTEATEEQKQILRYST